MNPTSKGLFASSLLALSIHAAAQSDANDDYQTSTFLPAVLVEQRWDDNITRANDPADAISSPITVLSPSIGFEAQSGANMYNASYRLEDGTYQDSSNDDYTDHFINAGANWVLDRRHRLSLNGALEFAHEARGSGFSQGAGNNVEIPDEYKAQRLDLGYTFGADTAKGRLEARIGSYGRDYDARIQDGTDITLTRDRSETNAGATFSWGISDRTRILIEANTKDISYDVAGAGGTLDSTESNVMVGMTWDTTGKTTGSVKIGARQKDFDAASRDDFSGPRWEVGLTFTPQTYSVISVSTARDSAETNGVGNFIDSTSWSFNWNHQWAERFSTTLSHSASDDDYDGTDRSDKVTNTTLRADYTFRETIVFGAGFTRSKNDSTTNTFDYDRDVVFISASITW